MAPFNLEKNFKENWVWILWAATSLVNFSTSYIAFNMSRYYESFLGENNIPHPNFLAFIIALNLTSSIGCLIIAYVYIKTRKQDKKNQYRLNLLSKKLLELQAQERESLARDIHDDLAQNVAALNLNLHLMKNACPATTEKQQEAYQKLKSCIDRLSKKISHIISELRTPDYSNPDFFETLQELISEYEIIFGIRIHTYFKFQNDIANQFTRENLYKTIKEALNNVCKHSNASQVKIHISRELDSLQTIVEDNGVGFMDQERDGSFGLKGMKERVDMMNGLLEIDSTPGIGTRVRIAVPLT